jgi:hypothetical protein
LSLSAVIAIVAILSSSLDRDDGRLVITSLGFSFYYALGAAGGRAMKARPWGRPLGAATVLGAVAGFALLALGVWPEAEVLRGWAIVTLITLGASHASLMLSAKRQSDSPVIEIVSRTAITAASLDAGLGALLLAGALQPDRDLLRALAVLAVIGVLTSLLPSVLRRARTGPERTELVKPAAG